MAERSQAMAATRTRNGHKESEGHRSLQRSRGAGQLARWDPFALLDELQDELARVWGRPLAMPSMMTRSMRTGGDGSMAETWAPRMDIYEQDGQLIVKAELPGVKKDDIRVEMEDGDLVISGERQEEREINEGDYYRIERSVGRFFRRIPIPFEANPDQIQARVEDGVLEVRIPRPSEQRSESRRIQVR
jgi:HSP20 family protein